MKKQAISLLVVVTLVFAGFTAGFFVGRSYSAGDIQIAVPAQLLTEPTQPPQTQPVRTVSAEAQTEPRETEPPETEPEIAFPIDLNTAGETELMALPGIGPVLAERILAYRRERGSFETVEELMNVSGIGEKRLEAIWDLVTIGG